MLCISCCCSPLADKEKTAFPQIYFLSLKPPSQSYFYFHMCQIKNYVYSDKMLKSQLNHISFVQNNMHDYNPNIPS